MSPAAVVWSESYPGTVLKSCGSAEAIEVHHYAGCALRIGGRASLCFDCGPDGGVYHPDIDGLLQEDELTLDADEAFTRVIKEANKLNRQYNQFRSHTHHTFVDGRGGPKIEHAHTDGNDAHRHAQTGPAYFVGSKKTARPFGPDLPVIELEERERTFAVVLEYRYVNTGQWDGEKNSGLSRAEWRRSMDFYVYAIRAQALGHPVDPRGPGAIPMTTQRLQDTFGMQPKYEIVGWRPTGPRRLP